MNNSSNPVKDEPAEPWGRIDPPDYTSGWELDAARGKRTQKSLAESITEIERCGFPVSIVSATIEILDIDGNRRRILIEPERTTEPV